MLVNLKDIADVIISNVDKKIKENEKKVYLCNFTDVYNNYAITKKGNINFMISSASKSQIDKFSIKKGYLAITKDSETRDDIGVGTFFADNFDNLLLGYHCALIKPNASLVNSKFLNAYIQSPFARKYYELNASGSGQRYTLTIDTIANTPIYLPAYDVQLKIGNLLSEIDKQIERNNAVVKRLQVLSHNIFQFYYSKHDKKKVKLKDIATMYQPETITGNDFISNGKYYVYGSGGIIGKYNKYNHKDSELMISCRGKCGNIALSLPYSWVIGNQMIVKPNKIQLKYYLYNYFKIINLNKIETGSVQKQITRSNLEKLEIQLLDENILLNLANKLHPIHKQIIEITINNEKLDKIKNKLLPMLINQQLV